MLTDGSSFVHRPFARHPGSARRPPCVKAVVYLLLLFLLQLLPPNFSTSPPPPPPPPSVGACTSVSSPPSQDVIAQEREIKRTFGLGLDRGGRPSRKKEISPPSVLPALAELHEPSATKNEWNVPFVIKHIFVNCLGLCLERPGCECQPKKRRKVLVDVIVGTNSSSTSQLCSTVQVKEIALCCTVLAVNLIFN